MRGAKQKQHRRLGDVVRGTRQGRWVMNTSASGGADGRVGWAAECAGALLHSAMLLPGGQWVRGAGDASSCADVVGATRCAVEVIGRGCD